jgi:hypothetical protein
VTRGERAFLLVAGNIAWGAAVCVIAGLIGSAALDHAPGSIAPALLVGVAIGAMVALYFGFTFLVGRLYRGPYDG